jgi:nucleoside triphosphatase
LLLFKPQDFSTLSALERATLPVMSDSSLATRPLATVGALVRCQDKYLIVETVKWRGSWGVPGGKIEQGETMEAALKREFLEEVGLALSEVRFAMVQEAVNSSEFYKDAHFILLNFFALAQSFTLEYNEEIVRHAWVTLREALEYPLNSYTVALVNRALEEAAQEAV